MVFSINPVYILLSGLLVAIASGLISSLLVLRRMTLVSDALSHVALPGIAIGLLFKFQPLVGGLLFLFAGIFFIWRIESQTKLAAESLTGVAFTTALAFGALLVPKTDLLEAFFGNIAKISPAQIAIQSLLAIIVIIITLRYMDKMVLSAIAPDLAVSIGYPLERLELLFLILIALTITIGISFVGILLMSALLIIPGVTARQLARSFKSFVSLSALLASIGLIGGLIISSFTKIEPGITTVLLSSGIFIISVTFSTGKRAI